MIIYYLYQAVQRCSTVSKIIKQSHFLNLRLKNYSKNRYQLARFYFALQYIYIYIYIYMCVYIYMYIYIIICIDVIISPLQFVHCFYLHSPHLAGGEGEIQKWTGRDVTIPCLNVNVSGRQKLHTPSAARQTVSRAHFKTHMAMLCNALNYWWVEAKSRNDTAVAEVSRCFYIPYFIRHLNIIMQQ